MQQQLKHVQIPVFLIQSRADQSVPAPHAEKIIEELGTSSKSVYWLEKSGHVVTRDIEREQVFEQISNFIQRICSNEVSV